MLGGRNNNFNLVRILAAFGVLVCHSLALSGTSPENIPLGVEVISHLGEWAVNIFFAISGFLVAGSYIKKSNTRNFIRSRSYRLLPALLVNCLFCAFVVGPVFTSIDLVSYFADAEVYKYVIKNTLLIHTEYYLPGVFLDNHYGETINGSLWSLRFEAKMYLVLAAVAILGIFSIRPFLYCFSAFCLFLWFAHTYCPSLWEEPESFDTFKRVATYFFIGSALQVWSKQIQLSWPIAIALVITSLLTLDYKIAPLFSTLAVTYLVFCFAYLIKGPMLNYNRYSDVSYGYYLYAFPVQQSLAHLYPDIGFYKMILFAGLLTWAFALASWKLVEKPALDRCKFLNKATV